MAVAALTLLSCHKLNLDVAPGLNSVATISGYLRTNFDFSLFYAAVQKADMEDSLDRSDLSYTVMAPTNSAFNKQGIFSVTDFDRFSADSLKTLIRNHLLPSKLFYSDISQGTDNLYKNLNGLQIYISKYPQGPIPLTVNGVIIQPTGTVSTAAARTYGSAQLNGVIYPLVSVLKMTKGTVQDMLASRPDLSRLVAGLKKYGFWDRLSGKGPFTVVAPQDTAFDAAGITAGFVDGINTSLYDPVLFGVYFISPDHIFCTDIVQLDQANLIAPTNSFHAYPTTSDTLDLVLGINYRGGMPSMSATVGKASDAANVILTAVGPTAHAFPDLNGGFFLGEPPGGPFYYIDANTPPVGTYIDFSCSNGVVHLFSQALLLPSDVKK